MTETDATAEPAARRPIAARDTRWAARAAVRLANAGVTPNQISVASVFFSLIGGAAMLATRWTGPRGDAALFVLAILGIQCRLLCNLFDGMVALEGGKAGKAGEVFNDFPDRVADPILLACAGYAAGGVWGVGLGWAAACMALMTAYVRVLGRSLGAKIYFIGPMAKQHRMAVLTATCAICAIATFAHRERLVLKLALGVIGLGCLITVIRRTKKVVADLEAKP
jgi:phosphatidylglycerophosphate synthase